MRARTCISLPLPKMNAYGSLSADSIRPLPVGELRLIDAVLVGMVGVLDNLIL